MKSTEMKHPRQNSLLTNATVQVTFTLMTLALMLSGDIGQVMAAADDLALHHSDDSVSQEFQGLYHSRDHFILSYRQMLSKFKIFVYPDPPAASRYHFFTFSTKSVSAFRVEELFFNSLVSSEFVTDKPEDADLFVLSISTSRVWDSPELGASKVSQYLKGYVDRQRELYPYWQRTLGADHVLVSCHDFPDDSGRTVLELKKNSIRIACYPAVDAAKPDLYPHKDFTMPSYLDEEASSSTGPVSPEEVMSAQRKFLLFAMGGNADAAAFSWWKEVEVVQDRHQARKKMLSSKFCLSFDENRDIWSVAEALRSGCVPVFISEHPFHFLPFQDLVNWKEAAVMIHLRDLVRLRSLVTGITETQYKQMQRHGLELSHHLSWHSSPVQYDAFYMLMLELWIRRHAVRYARRDAVQAA